MNKKTNSRRQQSPLLRRGLGEVEAGARLVAVISTVARSAKWRNLFPSWTAVNHFELPSSTLE